jgi:alkylation response protein AidB-like acyl-CoA dehydrogenase
VSEDFREIHDELRSVSRDMLAKAPVEWMRIAAAGWPGLEVPEDLGGAGATFVETAIVLEEIGRAAAANRFLGTTLAVGALTALPPNESRDVLLGRLAAGETAALASGFTLERGADGLVVSGRAEFVPDAEGADHLLLLARDPDGVQVLVAARAATVTPQPVLDETRALAVVTAEAAPVSHTWSPGVDPDVLVHRAAVAVACDSVGLAEAMLARTVDYTSVRNQFGRAIGSFQAVKHACADMLVQIAVARQLVDQAVAEVAAGVDASVTSAMAKSYATSMAVDVAGKAMQLHGGIGYTWESGVHVYLKRAALNRALFGSPSSHRRRLAARYG